MHNGRSALLALSLSLPAQGHPMSPVLLFAKAVSQGIVGTVMRPLLQLRQDHPALLLVPVVSLVLARGQFLR
jgi:hypothetical protein